MGIELKKPGSSSAPGVAANDGPDVAPGGAPRRAAASGAVRRVAIVGPSSASLRRLRDGLIGAIRERRHGVMCFAPEFDGADAIALDAMGVERRTLPARAPQFQFFRERRFVVALAEEFASWRPHVVLAYGGDTAAKAVQAARKAKVERIITIVNELPPGGAPLRRLSRMLELADSAVFHNGDDPKSLGRQGKLPGDLPFIVVPGAGVDLVHHGLQPLPPLADGLVFLMIARLSQEKGVLDYLAAARALKARAPSARFRLAGPPGAGPGAIAKSTLDGYRDCVEVMGPLDDVRPALGCCHVYVYPSHREGMPRSVLEAMAAGRPVITSAIAGCRDTVDERVNGCLVPPSDPEALAAAMESFLKRPDLIPSIARASRAKAERRFDMIAVNATLLEAMGLG